MMKMMHSKRKAFVKGGVVVLALFVVTAFLVCLFGGEAYLDFVGAIVLFTIGGLFGLGARWFYFRGVNDALKQEGESIKRPKQFPKKMEVFLAARPEYADSSFEVREDAYESWLASKQKEEW